LVSGLVDRGLDGAQNRKELHEMPAETLRELLAHAAWAAAVTVSRPGANPPTRAELNHLELESLERDAAAHAGEEFRNADSASN
jgi:fructokinase